MAENRDRAEKMALLSRQLTSRQKEVLAYLVKGSSHREIAERLGISVRTVEGHLSLIYDCLGVRTRSAATYVVMQMGILDSLPTVDEDT